MNSTASTGAGPLVLGIETSCDETGVGIVRGTTLLANTIASSMEEHARYGGVVPEVAARAHLEALTPTLRTAVADALLIENSVVNPFGLDRSSWKYGSNNVAAGTSSTVQIVATACPLRARRPNSARQSAVFLMTDNLLVVGVTELTE